jgi:hypothetical protein
VADGPLRLAGVTLGAKPKLIRRAYLRLREAGRLPASGCVRGADLEAEVVKATIRPSARALSGGPLPEAETPIIHEPAMSRGENPLTVVRRISKRSGGR